MINFWTGKRVIVPGGSGFLGTYLCEILVKRGCKIFVPRHCGYDLRWFDDTVSLFEDFKKANMVINLAANVGGIGYNQQHPYSLFYDNASMGINLIDQSIQNEVKKFVQVGTVCAYPKWTKPPFIEACLWDGYPEETNASYGLAKKMLLVQLQAARAEFGFNGIYLLPTNLYGPGDEFAPYRSHVIPALIRKFVEAKEQGLESVSVWGSGSASRDFLYVKDAAEAIVLAAEKYDSPYPMNIGSGREVRIDWLAQKIKELVGYTGKTHWDTSKPDGQPRRGLDISHIKHSLGWLPKVSLTDGLRETIEWYIEQQQIPEERELVNT